MGDIGQSVCKSKIIRIGGKPLKKQPDRLPWPRQAEDDQNVQLGIDVIKKEQDIRKIVGKFFKVKNYPMNDLLQEVFTAIIHKNRTRSAFDPRKSSFGHYIYMVGDHVCINIVNKKKRYDKESESLDAPVYASDNRPLMEVFEDESKRESYDDEFKKEMKGMANKFRFAGLFEEARYLTVAKTGVPPDVMRGVLSFGGKEFSNKDLRDIRARVEEALRTGVVKHPVFESVSF